MLEHKAPELHGRSMSFPLRRSTSAIDFLYTFSTGEQRAVALPAARRQVPQVDLSWETVRYLSTASSSSVPVAVANAAVSDGPQQHLRPYVLRHSDPSGAPAVASPARTRWHIDWICRRDLRGAPGRTDGGLWMLFETMDICDDCSGRCVMRTEPWVA
ncbi:hypothetical protein F2P81_009027 [Scophthalmus maximus]|uniref:Uncharacterized protein n=1 Tax=Scophthalmus maximus TaxID=52904 RepID=A0A6A4SXM4_SCOMX|nr:hypothetical protein F2P81_009027 [Scophthalmus maximus]